MTDLGSACDVRPISLTGDGRARTAPRIRTFDLSMRCVASRREAGRQGRSRRDPHRRGGSAGEHITNRIGKRNNALVLQSRVEVNVGQATKGARWMPWYHGPKKGVARLRKASVSRLTGVAGDSRMRQLTWSHVQVSRIEHIDPMRVTRGTEPSKYPEEKKAFR